VGSSTCVRCGTTEHNTAITMRAKVPIPWGWMLIDGGGNRLCERCIPIYRAMKASDSPSDEPKCQCPCHKDPSVMHIVPCCSPNESKASK
jgi:hypothetical protein